MGELFTARSNSLARVALPGPFGTGMMPTAVNIACSALFEAGVHVYRSRRIIGFTGERVEVDVFNRPACERKV